MLDGGCIKNFRRYTGLSQREFAAKCGVAVETIQRAEYGECLTPKTLMKVCDAFKVKAEDLKNFTREDIPGIRIMNLRMKKGWTQEELALESGVTQPLISAYESGKIIPKVKTQWKIIAALGVKNENWR